MGARATTLNWRPRRGAIAVSPPGHATRDPQQGTRNKGSESLNAEEIMDSDPMVALRLAPTEATRRWAAVLQQLVEVAPSRALAATA
jgi:hypothetical protein